ncbi:MAG: hypothetical protein FWH20_06175 [Oscillospiraceae bacterium]|nr:hypothetical protein [Oscillospiraceae bacterium]
MKKATKNFAAGVVATAIIFMLFVDMNSMAAAVVSGVETCLYTIIPALFGFMAIASYLVNSGLYRVLFKPLYLVFRPLIRISEEEFAIFLLSLFGGYPVGAKLIAESTEKRDISAKLENRSGFKFSGDCAVATAHRSPQTAESRLTLMRETHQKLNGDILPFCYCPSPGFAVAVVGVGIFSNSTAGIVVYMSCFLTCFLIAAILTFKKSVNSNSPKIPKPAKNKPPPLQLTQEVFTTSVISSASALFPVCVLIISFSVIIEALKSCGVERVLGLLGENAAALFFAALEITNAAKLPADYAILPLIAGLFSFGGLCILMQVPALTKGKFSLKKFLLWRIPGALISAVICKVFLHLFDLETALPAATSPIQQKIPLEAGNPVASIALFCMAVILIKSLQEFEEG